MAALALNRPDWLAAMKYTIVEALERIGPEWRAALPAVARAASEQIQQRESARESADEALHIARFAATSARGREPIDCVARLVTSGSAPGYRDVNFTLELQPRSSKQSLLVALQVQPADGEAIARHIHEVHSFAWRRGTPLDAQPDEEAASVGRRPVLISSRASRVATCCGQSARRKKNAAQGLGGAKEEEVGGMVRPAARKLRWARSRGSHTGEIGD